MLHSEVLVIQPLLIALRELPWAYCYRLPVIYDWSPEQSLKTNRLSPGLFHYSSSQLHTCWTSSAVAINQHMWHSEHFWNHFLESIVTFGCWDIWNFSGTFVCFGQSTHDAVICSLRWHIIWVVKYTHHKLDKSWCS